MTAATPMTSGPDEPPIGGGPGDDLDDLAGGGWDDLIDPDPARIFQYALAEFDRLKPAAPTEDRT